MAASRLRRTAAAALLGVFVTACADSGSDRSAATLPAAPPSATAPPTTAPPTTTTPPTTTPDTTTPDTTAAPTSTVDPRTVDMRGLRYCEVLLVGIVDGAAVADVYNSYPMNDCPAEQWKALDAATIASDESAVLAVLNGPRYWLMNRIEKAPSPDQISKTFGGIEMVRRATVEVGDLKEAAVPYTPHAVNRATVFVFDPGMKVYELTDPDGVTYVMQTYSQQIDPQLVEADLADLAARLKLPDGWTYSSRVLAAPLRVVTTDGPAFVLQDDLGNSYSRETTP